MAHEPLLIGIDIGTSGCKTVLMNSRGVVVGRAYEEYPLYNERHGWSEQDPVDWWEAAYKSLRDLLRSDTSFSARVKGIGLSGQMHGLVPLDGQGNILRRSILWNDQRTGTECEEIHAAVGGVEELLKITNNPMLPGYTGGKLLWLKKHEPENFKRIETFLNPKDYLRYKLTGDLATEVSDASGTGLFNVKGRKWASNLFDLIGIPQEWTPEVYESTQVTGVVKREIARELGLPDPTPVVGGGGDAVIQTLGTGVVSSDVLMTTIGTAGIISTALEEFKPNPKGRLQVFCNVVPKTWHIMGVTLSAGSSLRWFRDRFARAEKLVAGEIGKNEYELLTETATRSMPGAGGLIFLPYLSGERCPYADPDLRGAFIGLSLKSTRADLIRSVMEGVILSLRDVNEIFREMGMNFRNISTSGGGAQSELWRRIHADIFQKEVITVNGSREGAAYGAAMVAAVGVRVWDSFESGIGTLQRETETHPDSQNKLVYDRLYKVYHGLYDALKQSFSALSDFE